jgi:hypothetical protein
MNTTSRERGKGKVARIALKAKMLKGERGTEEQECTYTDHVNVLTPTP